MTKPREAKLGIGYLRDILSYNPETGDFLWKVSRQGRKFGIPTGYLGRDGARTIRIDRTSYLAHRLAWFHYYGQWPKDQIDHINCNRSDNRIVNLRESSQLENRHNIRKNSNNTSGYKGVSWHADTAKWRARITYMHKEYHLGLFDTAEEAHAAYCRAAILFYGEFARFA